jgi:hypothetical protein
MEALVYDLEIKRGVPMRGDSRLDGVEYCAGWHDHPNMGVAVLCAYDYAEDRYRVFDEATLPEFAALAQRRAPLVGFNNVAFDNAVLRCAGVTIDPARCYDLLREVWSAVGLGPAFNYRTHGGYGLDDLCAATLGERKSGRGDLAPVWYQRGEYARVVDYCLQDVRLTKRLYDRVIAGEPIIDPHDLKALALRPLQPA